MCTSARTGGALDKKDKQNTRLLKRSKMRRRKQKHNIYIYMVGWYSGPQVTKTDFFSFCLLGFSIRFPNDTSPPPLSGSRKSKQTVGCRFFFLHAHPWWDCSLGLVQTYHSTIVVLFRYPCRDMNILGQKPHFLRLRTLGTLRNRFRSKVPAYILKTNTYIYASYAKR